MKLSEMQTTQEQKFMKLTDEQKKKYLAEIKNWQLKEKSLEKEFVFEKYAEGVIFANKVASLADKINHHPDIFIGFKKVKISLWTHKISDVSLNDFILAAKIDLL